MDQAFEAPVNSRRRIWTEIWLLLGLSLGRSGVYSIVNIIGRLTDSRALAEQTAGLNQTQSPRPYLDLTYQLLGIFFALVPVALAIFFLNSRILRHPAADAAPPCHPAADVVGAQGPLPGPTDSALPQAARRMTGAREALGLDRIRASDIGWGLALFAGIGIPGYAFYLLGRALGITVQVSASGLGDFWWAIPVLILSAIENGILEEVIVVGYLFERTRDLGWNGGFDRLNHRVIDWRFIAFSALLRGSYHLYQGIGPFIGNVVMGVVFAWWYRSKWGRNRVLPLIIAHAVIDIVAFVGYAVMPDAWAAWLGLR